ncbi:right-handed parallel beta-helix repeat-containing protein [Bartonella schoenbuchensis]|uniref:right-handed parallel beta-helix repeat-containing protein n=1 Tax=Bartonella schoenbuchensis TaxID=165694 RepID=UPI0031456F09
MTIKGSGEKGVSVSGGTVMMKQVDISEFTTGITMTGGRSLKLDGGSIRGNNRGMGINVTKGGTVTVEGVNISDFATGIDMDGSGTLTVENGTRIEFGHSGTGVKVGTSVTMTSLTGVTIEGSGGGMGVWVKGGTVMMDRVGITLQGSGTGIYMTGGETLTVSGGEITGVKMGITMMGGEVTISGTTTISFTGDDGYGVKVGDKVQSTSLTGVTIEGSGGNGVGVYAEGKNLTVKGTTKITGVKVGISMKGSGTLTVEEGTRINFMGEYGIGYGVYVGKGVRAKLTDVTITGSGSGYGVEVMVEEGAAALIGVTMTYKGDNRGAQGANTTSPSFIKVDGGKVLAEKVTITGNEQGLGVKVSNGGHVTLKQSHVPIQPTIHITHNLIL